MAPFALFTRVSLLVALLLPGWVVAAGLNYAVRLVRGGPTVYENTRRSGNVDSDEIWKGVIDITGDVVIHSPATVIIEPGSIIRFSAGADDQYGGGTTPITDPYFPHDPAIAPSQMSSIMVFGGTLYAVGTSNQRITFTSSSQNMEPGDWHSLQYGKAGSKLILQYTTIEYGYYGIQVNDTAIEPDIILKNNIIRHIVACGVCTGSTSTTITISDNDISYCGHEGIDTHSDANIIIENNVLHDINNYVDPSGSGVIIDNNNSVIRNNQFLRNRFGINIISPDNHPSISGNTFVDNWADCFGFCPSPLQLPSGLALAGLTAPTNGQIYYTANLTTWVNVTGALNQLQVGDFNGDGQTDLVGVASNGSLWYTTNLSTWTQIPGALSQLVVGNFNGDGYADLAGLASNGTVWYTTDLGTWHRIPGALSQLVAGNFNGDGYADLAGLASNGSIWYTVNLSTWTQVPGTLSQLVAGDLNGDGHADLAGLTSNGTIWYTTSLGASWTQIPGALSQLVVGDLNGDGKADLAGLASNGSIWYTTNLSAWTQIPGALSQLVVGDLNGDGHADLAGLANNGTIWYTVNLSTWTNIPGRLAQLVGN